MRWFLLKVQRGKTDNSFSNHPLPAHAFHAIQSEPDAHTWELVWKCMQKKFYIQGYFRKKNKIMCIHINSYRQYTSQTRRLWSERVLILCTTHISNHRHTFRTNSSSSVWCRISHRTKILSAMGDSNRGLTSERPVFYHYTNNSPIKKLEISMNT